MKNQFLYPFITGIFISAAAGYLGSLMLSRRMALVAGPLGHLTLPGIALALLYGFNVSLGAFPFVLLGTLIIWLLEIKTRLPMEALTAVIFSLGVAIAFLFLPIGQAETALIGDISQVNFLEMVGSVIISLILIVIIKIIYPKLVLINISEDLAKSENINIKKYNFIYLVLIACIVALGVKIVGGLLTAALVSIPAATANNFSRNLSQYTLGSITLGVIAACAGVALYGATKILCGPLIIIISATMFLISTLFKK